MFLTSGKQTYGMLFKPINCVSGQKYPTLLYVYGGPGVQVRLFNLLWWYVDSQRALVFEVKNVNGFELTHN